MNKIQVDNSLKGGGVECDLVWAKPRKATLVPFLPLALDPFEPLVSVLH